MLTDVFLLLDKKLGKNALKPDRKFNQTKMTLAAMEGCKAKRLLGALRALWRSSARKGQDGNVTHLKSFLVLSPLQHRSAPLPLPAPPAPPTDDDSDDESNDGSHDGEVDRHDDGSHDGEGDGGHEDGSHDGEGDGDHEDGSHDGDGDHEDGSHDGEGHGDHGEDSADDGLVRCSQNSSDSTVATLDASTLALGSPSPPSPPSPPVLKDESDSEMSEDQRDSQIPGAGWMGRAMMASRHLEKEEKEKAKLNDRLKQLVSSVKAGLRWQVSNAEYLDGSQLEDYAEWCHEAFKTYGENVFGKLCDMDFFKRWALEQKRGVVQDWTLGTYSKYFEHKLFSSW